MIVTNKYEFTAVNAHDLLEKIKIRTEAMGLTTVHYADNIISGTTIGKRLHIQIGNNFLNIASAVQMHPCAPTLTNWTGSNAQVVAATISRTFDNTKTWFGNESYSSTNRVPCVSLKNNSQCWIFTSSNSIAIVTNLDNINYTCLYINFETSLCFLSSNKYTNTNGTPLDHFIRLFQSGSDTNLYINGTTYDNNVLRAFEDTSSNIYRYDIIYDKTFNLVNNASIILPVNLYINTGTTNPRFRLIKTCKDIGVFNLKNTDPKYQFLISNKEYIVFPDDFKDVSSSKSMGICFRTV